MCTSDDLYLVNYRYILCACSILLLANVGVVIKILKSFKDTEKRSVSLLALSLGFILYSICWGISIIAVRQWLTAENAYLSLMGEPLSGLPWAMVTCVTGWFATIYIKLLCNLFLAMAYLRSFYKMRAILTNEKPYPAKYIDYGKWFVVISAGLLCTSLMVVDIIWYV